MTFTKTEEIEYDPYLHIFIHGAIGPYSIVWTDNNGEIKSAPISIETANALIADGMDFEG